MCTSGKPAEAGKGEDATGAGGPFAGSAGDFASADAGVDLFQCAVIPSPSVLLSRDSLRLPDLNRELPVLSVPSTSAASSFSSSSDSSSSSALSA